jgi:hypothetical protein
VAEGFHSAASRKSGPPRKDPARPRHDARFRSSLSTQAPRQRRGMLSWSEMPKAQGPPCQSRVFAASPPFHLAIPG